MKTVINKKDPQVIYDCCFTSKSEFILIYGDYYEDYSELELGRIWHEVRETEKSYDPSLRKTKRGEVGLKKPSEVKSIDVKVEVKVPVDSITQETVIEKVIEDRPKGWKKKAVIDCIEGGLSDLEIKQKYGESISKMYIKNVRRKYEESLT